MAVPLAFLSGGCTASSTGPGSAVEVAFGQEERAEAVMGVGKPRGQVDGGAVGGLRLTGAAGGGSADGSTTTNSTTTTSPGVDA